LHRKDIRMVASNSDDGLWVGPPVAQVGRYHANDGGSGSARPRVYHGNCTATVATVTAPATATAIQLPDTANGIIANGAANVR
jgi:hypothetical protein